MVLDSTTAGNAAQNLLDHHARLTIARVGRQLEQLARRIHAEAITSIGELPGNERGIIDAFQRVGLAISTFKAEADKLIESSPVVIALEADPDCYANPFSEDGR